MKMRGISGEMTISWGRNQKRDQNCSEEPGSLSVFPKEESGRYSRTVACIYSSELKD